jgi:cellulose synthase operon protein C
LLPNKVLLSILALMLLALPSQPQLAYAKTKKEKESGLQALKFKQGDEKGNDMKSLQTELLIASTEEKAIEQTEKLIKKYRGNILEADLQLRLAELHMRRAKTDRFLEIQRKSEAMISLAPKMIQNAASKKHVMKAISVYDSLEKRFPGYERLDQAIFNNAFASQQIGDDKKAERLFNRLIKDFPSSMLIPDAHLAVGEMSFQRRDFAGALKNFQAIKNYPDSMVYAYGLYKSSWTYYNMRDTSTALKELEAVVKYGKFVREQGIDSRLDLRKEALNDMTLFYEEVLPAKNAYSYFEKQAGEIDIAPILIRLSELYKRHSRFEDNRVLLAEYIKRLSTSDYLPKAYVELADSNDKLKRPKDVITLMSDLQKVCEPGSRWSKAQTTIRPDSPLMDLVDEETKKPITAQDICFKVFRKTTVLYANRWLKNWQKFTDQKSSDAKTHADGAEEAFKLHLTQDDKSEESNRARYVFADLLFKREKFREASAQYAIAGEQTQDKTLRHDARYYAVVSLEKATKDKWNDKDETLYKKLAGDYLRENANGPYSLDIQFKTALIAYEKARYDEAAVQFKLLGEKHAHVDKGVKSQDIYLDILNIKKDYPSLRDYSLSLRNTTKVPARKEKLTKIYEEAYFLIVQELENKGGEAEAIEKYEQFASTNAQSPLAQKSLWNAMQLQFKLGNLVDGSNASINYYNKYPETKEGRDALLKAAETYETLGLLDKAATTLLLLAKSDLANQSKWRLMAADYYTVLGEYKLAKPLYEELKNKPVVQARSLEQLEYIAKAENNVPAREKLLREISALGVQPQASLAQLYFVEKAFENKEYESVFNLSKKLVGSSDKGVSNYAKAKARLLQARVLDKEYREQSLKSQVDRVHIVLQLKTEKLSKAQIAFQSAANYSEPMITVEALNALSDSYFHYVQAIKDMPIPKGIPPEEEAVFRSELAKISLPMEEKSIEAKSMALKQAIAMQVRDGSIPKLTVEIDRMNQTNRMDTLVDFAGPDSLLADEDGLYGKLPVSTKVNPLSCPSGDKNWVKDNLRSLIGILNNCATLKKTDRVNVIAKHLSVEFLKEGWGPYYLSLAAADKGLLPLAIWYADLGLRRQPNSSLLAYQKGRIQWMLGDYNAAIKSIKVASESNPRFLEAHLALGRIYYRDSDLKSASVHFDQVLKIDPANAVALVGLAELRRKKSDNKEAVTLLEKAVSSSPRSLDYRLRLADMYEIEQRYDDALTAYKRIKNLIKEQRSPAQDAYANIDDKIKTLETLIAKNSEKKASK